MQIDRVAVGAPRIRLVVGLYEIGHATQVFDLLGQDVVEDQGAGGSEIEELREERGTETLYPSPRFSVRCGALFGVVPAEEHCITGDHIVGRGSSSCVQHLVETTVC